MNVSTAYSSIQAENMSLGSPCYTVGSHQPTSRENFKRNNQLR